MPNLREMRPEKIKKCDKHPDWILPSGINCPDCLYEEAGKCSWYRGDNSREGVRKTAIAVETAIDTLENADTRTYIDSVWKRDGAYAALREARNYHKALTG